MTTNSQRNPYAAPEAKLGEPERHHNWLYGKGRFGNVLIPPHPVVRTCEHCNEGREFRVFIQTECSHLLMIFQWNYVSTFFRICGTCDHAFKLSHREIREILPQYRPPAPKIVRHAVIAAYCVVAFVIFAYVVLRHYWPF